jgi:hypothetical protein
LVELHRRDPEVEERAVDRRHAERVERVREGGEVLADERDRRGEIGREPGAGVAVERDDRAAARDDRARVAAGAVGSVEVQPAGADGQRIQRFVEQDGKMFINRARAPS